jgi:predicted  nucleic acid-binding Zn-ribbon protein
MPTGDAGVFDIGEKFESDIISNYYHSFDSGLLIRATKGLYNVTKIFDGNESTGINEVMSGHNSITWRLIFPDSLFVNNITIKPTFGGGTSNYDIQVSIFSSVLLAHNSVSTEKTLNVNCSITHLSLTIYEKGINQFYFNDVLINFTFNLTDLNSVNQALNILQNSINSLQNQINNLTNQFNKFNNLIVELNNSIGNIDQTQKKVLENITNLWNKYQQLNESIMDQYKKIESLNIYTQENITNLRTNYNQLNNSLIDLYNKIENMNLTTYNNITQLENDLLLIQNNITEIQKDLNNISIDINKLPEFQSQIDQATFNINNLNENITEIKTTMPSEYDDIKLVNRIIQLESENSNLKTEILNNTAEIELLTSELEKIKTTDKEKVIEKKADNTIGYSAILVGILGIVIAILAIALLFKKIGKPPEPPNEELRKPGTPEQQVIPETETTTQEQIQKTQVQETPQMQQQQGIG